MDSNGNRIIPYLQEQYPEMECRPQYKTTELRNIAETLDDINETDTIAILTGPNDIRNHTPNQENAENIQEALKKHPTNNILLVQPPPIITNDVTITYNILRLSDSLEKIAKEEKRIKYVETEETINKGSTAMEHDGYHLNQTGRQLHAAAILQAIDETCQPSGTHNRKTRTYQETNRGPTPNQNKDNRPRRDRRIHHHHHRKPTKNQISQTTHNTNPMKQRNGDIDETTATPE